MISFKRYFETYFIPMDEVNKRLSSELAGLNFSYGENEETLVGKPMRNLDITSNNGEKYTIFELLRDQKFLLIDLTNTETPEVPESVTNYIHCISGSITEHEDVKGISTLFIRPDGHVAWASSEKFNASDFQKELTKWF
ncbi:aromatic-ring hydroxylase C-terminal domain-containing protein [Staphylococcus caledonicus]|uniref:aromatic-ring hydroxylase C-terminal domain-containing protein n=1 Tax=Staphylococcus caledonicus TaxID=2741333 RepID=UPI0018E4CC6E|nr:hypothetical protein [Staphylococcus caledonicus]MBI5972756.1 hypothetical protein [Staphylococcus caledonicus]